MTGGIDRIARQRVEPARPVVGFSPIWLRALVAGLSLAAGSTASAQYMAQNGNALSRGLARNNPYAGSSRDFAAEAKYRNSIVFSQAPGGFSFRGRLGYSDPAEFVGRLGSSSLNSFKRNSELSTVAGQGIRPTSAIGARNALATGAASGPYQPGRGSVDYSAFYTPRTGYGKPLSTQGANAALPSLSNSSAARAFQNPAIKRDDLRDKNYNIVNRLSAGVNSSTSYGADSSSRLSGLSNSSYSSSTRSTDMSERLGISSPSTKISNMDFGRTDFGTSLDGDRTLANSAQAQGRVQRSLSDSQRSRTQVEDARPGGPASARIDNSARPELVPNALGTPASQVTSYDELRSKLDALGIRGNALPVPGEGEEGKTDGAGGAGGAARDWRDRLSDLRSQLLRPEGAFPDRISLLDRSKRPARPGEIRPEATEATPKEGEAAGEKGDQKADDATLRNRIDPQTLKMIRDVSGDVNSFISSTGGKRDYYTEHMQAGQNLLSKHMYFDAEERFNRALSNKPGDVSARTGQIHAEVGAGLWMTAGQRLRRLIAEHPETVGQRYAADLLPDIDRTRRAIDQLRASVAGTGQQRRESALLIAYLGFQTSSMAVAREGLDAMARVAEEDPGAGSDERLVELLRGVWLDPKLYENGHHAAPAPSAADGESAPK